VGNWCRWVALLWVLAGARVVAAAEPVTLKFATIIPDGSEYSRDAKAFARDVEAGTDGRVKVKWVFGAIAGDERQTIERIRRGQLHGAATSLGCASLAPSLQVFRLPGQFDDRQQARQVMARLRGAVEQELKKNGFALLGMEPFGADIVLSQQPIRSLADLRRARVWLWDQDDVWAAVAPRVGFNPITAPVEGVSHLIEERRIDAVISLPTAALAYQWSSRMSYFTPIQSSYLQACLIVSNRAFDALSIADQTTMRAAGAKAAAHFDKVCESQDAQLLGGLLEKQGLKKIPVSAAFKTEFNTALRAATQQLDDRLIPRALRDRVATWITELRK
jgi:TRAP-type C4-dicarboxylate transport system substrate-binding protein